MDAGLAGKVVLLTGASGGIGQAAAREFLAEGAKLAAHYHRGDERLRANLTGAAGTWLPFKADVTIESDVQSMFADVEKQFGPVEVLVANAGYWPPEDRLLHELSLERWHATIAADLTSVFLCAREFMRGIVKYKLHAPAIVLVGSTAGTFGEAGHADYAAAKAGVIYGMARTLKNEICRIAPRGRVNVVSPGWTVTPMVDRFTGNLPKVRRVLQTIPLRKVAKPEDVAHAMVYLASEKLAGHVSGTILTVHGGMEGRVLYAPEEVDPEKAL